MLGRVQLGHRHKAATLASVGASLSFVASASTMSCPVTMYVDKVCRWSMKHLQRVPVLRAFWDLEKTVLHEIRVSGTLLWSPTNANSPTYTYISQKTC